MSLPLINRMSHKWAVERVVKARVALKLNPTEENRKTAAECQVKLSYENHQVARLIADEIWKSGGHGR